MIVEMVRVRILGPRAALHDTIVVLQDLGVLHVVDATCAGGLARPAPDPVARRRRKHLAKALVDVDAALADLAKLGVIVEERALGPPAEGAAARLAARTSAATAALRAREAALRDEREALRMYEPLFVELETLLGARTQRRTSVYLLVLRDPAATEALRGALDRALDGAFALRTHALASGESIALLIVPETAGESIDRLLAEARVERAPLPAGLGTTSVADALARMRPRLAEVDAGLARVRDEARALARDRGAELTAARRLFHDALLVLDATEHATVSRRVFLVEGWVPVHDRAALATRLLARCGREVTIEDVARDSVRGDEAPVVLANPRVFAPFEALTSLLPLPRYGSVDPTPFVAVFFPMFFGVVVGDIGYGLVMAVLSIAVRVLGRRRPLARDIAKISAAVALYSIIFGALYGELFGDLGEQVLGMQPLWFDRREAVLAFLVLATALGVVHLVLGLVVAAANRWHRHPREALGRGLTALMLLLVVVALLVVFEWLPGALLTPVVIALLVSFPLIVVLEGATALLDFMTIVGHVLSYARVMALGTASVMLAVVANRMVGAFGSLAIGIAFALLFHLVNFAITLFSPTIHVMRLHYVEFFGTFFEPGGGSYRPLRHWSPETT